jgi:hypothetical protein
MVSDYAGIMRPSPVSKPSSIYTSYGSKSHIKWLISVAGALVYYVGSDIGSIVLEYIPVSTHYRGKPKALYHPLEYCDSETQILLEKNWRGVFPDGRFSLRHLGVALVDIDELIDDLDNIDTRRSVLGRHQWDACMRHRMSLIRMLLGCVPRYEVRYEPDVMEKVRSMFERHLPTQQKS